MSLLHKKNGKILYGVAYMNPLPGLMYLLARNWTDAKFQVMRQKRNLGHVMAIAPAIGVFGQHEERTKEYVVMPGLGESNAEK